MTQWEYFSEFYTLRETEQNLSDSRGNHTKLMMNYHGSHGWEAYTVVHATELLHGLSNEEPELTSGYRVFYRRPLGSGT